MKKIRLAIIGCGSFVRYHVKRMAGPIARVPELECAALVDIRPDHAEKLVAETESFAKNPPPLFTDYRRMLKEIRPDAVIVSTPHTLHFPMAFDALAAGANVMIDKPMVTDSTAARKLVQRARAKKRVLQIAIQGTYTDTFAYARKLLTDGTMGKLQLVTGILAQGWMKFTVGAWRQDPKLSGGGQMYDSGCHVLSAMLFLVDSPVSEVFCWTDNKRTRVDINAVATIRFANGCMATMTSGGDCPSWKSHLILQGDNAIMEISPHGGDFRVHRDYMKKEITAVPRGWKIKSVTPVRNFTDSILGKDTPRCPAQLGGRMADLMDALYESASAGKPVKVRRRKEE